MTAFHAVVLAAGQGTRMKSARSKVLHPLAGLPMVSHVLNAAMGAGASDCALVVPPGTDAFEPVVAKAPVPARLYVQADRLGTAHAVLMARAALENANGPVLVLYGDTPLITPQGLRKLIGALSNGAHMAVMGFNARNPHGYGRLLTNGSGELLAIREEKDATGEERQVTLCNSGIMAFQGNLVLSLLDRIGTNNSQGEYYLTDAVEICRSDGLRVAYEVVDEDEVRGVNTRAQLSEAEAIMQQRLRRRAMDGGATLIAPETVTLSHDTIIGQDVLIEPNVIFGEGVVLDDDVTIKGFCHIENSHIKRGSIIGPFARLRPGTKIGENVRIGNFVELKHSDIKAGVKVNHLSYVGDSEVGEDANIGAGTITCNYDGHNKHRTEIGAGAFIGSNSALVAPVKIGAGAYVASGSVIGKEVPANALAITRAPQVNHEEWASRMRARHAAAQGKSSADDK